MMSFQRYRKVAAGSACPEKGITRFHVAHQKATCAWLGPFLIFADAEHGHIAMHSPGAAVMASEHAAMSAHARSRTEANGKTIRTIAERMEGCPNA
jgi:hypothetical protein